MRLEQDFQVDAPVEEVYAALLDLERVAPCLPGAQVLERTGENAWSVALHVKLGPISVQYRGELERTEQDAAGHRAVLTGRGRELRGQGTARGRAEIALRAEGRMTRARLEADLQLSGRAASLGRGLLQDVAARLTEEFARNLSAELAAGAAPSEGGSPPAAERPSAAPTPRREGDALRAGPLLAGALAARPHRLLLAGALLLALGFLAGRC